MILPPIRLTAKGGVRRAEHSFADHTRTQELYDALADKEVVICNEVGSGVIPVERNVRLGREAAGRLCVLLAKDAEAVVRMVCGIPTIIKGQI